MSSFFIYLGFLLAIALISFLAGRASGDGGTIPPIWYLIQCPISMAASYWGLAQFGLLK